MFWTNISTKLPDELIDVLVTIEDVNSDKREVTLGFRFDDVWRLCDNSLTIRDRKVVAWMPLPESYKW